MVTTIEEIASHEACSQLNRLAEQVAAIEALHLTWQSSDRPQALSRIATVARDILDRLMQSKPALITTSSLSQIASAGTALSTQLQQFLDEKTENGGYKGELLTSAEPLIDDLVSSAGNIPAVPWAVDEDVARRAVGRFRDQIRDVLKKFETDSGIAQRAAAVAQRKTAGLEKQIDAGLTTTAERVATALATSEEQVAQAISKLNADFAAEQESLRQASSAATASIESIRAEATEALATTKTQAEAFKTEFKDNLDEITTSAETARVEIAERSAAAAQAFDDAVLAVEGKFAASQEDREKRFGKADGDRRAEFASLIAQIKADAKSASDELSRYESDQRDRIADLTTQTEALLGFAGAASTVGSYQREANSQKAAADAWRYVTVGLLVTALAIAVWVVAWLPIPAQLDLAHFIANYSPRTAMLAIAGGAAAYAGGQSARHRRREERARRLENELSTFRPFLVELPVTKRQELIEKMAAKMFRGQDGIPESAPEEPVTTAPFQNPLNGAIDRIKDALPRIAETD